jgi:hypothetical protein
MYDRQTESLWSHFTAGAVVGFLTGTELDLFPLQTVSFADFRAAHPTGLVLSRDTGFDREYGRNPYTNYDNPASRPVLFRGEYDRVLPAKTRVLTVQHGGEAVAIVHAALVDRRVLEFDIGGETLVALAKPGTVSALDTRSIVDGRDIGATGVFVPGADGQSVTLSAEGGAFRDVETGSTWNVLGRAVEGPLRGSQLQPVEHLDTFWFAWSAFQPETTILLADSAATPPQRPTSSSTPTDGYSTGGEGGKRTVRADAPFSSGTYVTVLRVSRTRRRHRTARPTPSTRRRRAASTATSAPRRRQPSCEARPRCTS